MELRSLIPAAILALSLSACQLPTRGERELLDAVKGAETRKDLEARLGAKTHFQRYSETPRFFSSKTYWLPEYYDTPLGMLEVEYMGNFRWEQGPRDPNEPRPTNDVDRIMAELSRNRMVPEAHADDPVWGVERYRDPRAEGLSEAERHVYFTARFAGTRSEFEKGFPSKPKLIATEFRGDKWERDKFGGTLLTFNQVYQVQGIPVLLTYIVEPDQATARTPSNPKILELAPAPDDILSYVQILKPDEFSSYTR